MTKKTETQTLVQRLERYEGRVEHIYLDTEGYVTVGVGHLIVNADAAKRLNFVHQKTNKKATEDQIVEDYNSVKKQVKGLVANSYRRFTKLKLSNVDIDKLTNQHVAQFERELGKIYGSEAFSNYPSKVRLALFDMIFNLGMTKLRNEFVNFNLHIKDRDWLLAAEESNRLGIADARNTYVRELLEKAGQEASDGSNS